ncbi:hypothetical protein TPHA_0I01080 [Tetrapisispora phaffii CBS 4417]|uniref:Nucleolar protein Dnt1-like N-terminal domain-containing protein n=1 Tax=Tetrapisispora phaffii (strain ATCC 24235 / CBS 4417 / NBRC 1672 / NRRL Y-8282 / UCD 70-5) TaxID=1071381 RepID=G8BXI6_TETPH|nr:hypothetical protein TPHA_0I01080 [Tetrapisispora phaffii CBS 4417]CCE64614.1 hypothetical protein TPHA_0I01080 [Tetrapisispora phaffii CBS 4417]
MYKLQIELVPLNNASNAASVINDPYNQFYGNGNNNSISSDLKGRVPSFQVSQLHQYQDRTFTNTNNSFVLPSHSSFNNNGNKKFLLFTKQSNSLYDLSQEIIAKCEKMYSDMKQTIDIESLQDCNGCDLDPDFIVKDVFLYDNNVRVILKHDIEFNNDKRSVSSYGLSKKRKMNNGVAQQISAPLSSPYRDQSSKTNNKLRISTPLANQIYPNQTQQKKEQLALATQVDTAAVDRSFLPPPFQPQSPGIVISSGADKSKRILSMDDQNNSVSKSETVDPDKSKRQILLSGAPLMSTMTPNRVTLTGQRVVSEKSNINSKEVFTSMEKNGLKTPRITSGMLKIPEPKIQEAERALQEGPSSPASALPLKNNITPKKDKSDNITFSSEDEDRKDSSSKPSNYHERSIANDNGSPVRQAQFDDKFQILNLKNLPSSNEAPAQLRKSSLEEKVQSKSNSDLFEKVEPRIINNFNEIKEGNTEAINPKISKLFSNSRSIVGSKADSSHFESKNTESIDDKAATDEDEDDVGNETVRINKNITTNTAPVNSDAERRKLEQEEKKKLAQMRKKAAEEKQILLEVEKHRLVEAAKQKAAEEKQRLLEEEKQKAAEAARKKIAEEKQRLLEAAKKKAAEEKQRLLEEEKQKAAEEKQRLLEEEKQKAAEAARKKIAEEKQRLLQEKEKKAIEEKQKLVQQKQRLDKVAKQKAMEEKYKLLEEEKKKSAGHQPASTSVATPVNSIAGVNILKELKAKYTDPQPRVSSGLKPNSNSSDDSSEDDSSNSSSSEQSSSSEESGEEENSHKKVRRGIVGTPKGQLGTRTPPLRSTSSTATTSLLNNDDKSKMAVTKKSPSDKIEESLSIASTQKSPIAISKLPPKMRPSLSSLSDLVSRGVPDVREKSFKFSQSPKQASIKEASYTSSSSSNDSTTDYSSDSSDDSDSSSSSDDSEGYISIKFASQN